MDRQIQALINEQSYYYSKFMDTGDYRYMNVFRDIEYELEEAVQKRIWLNKIIKTEYTLIELIGQDVASIVVEYLFMPEKPSEPL